MVTDLVQKTFERFPWKDLEVAHVLKVLSFWSWWILNVEMSWKCLFSVMTFWTLSYTYKCNVWNALALCHELEYLSQCELDTGLSCSWHCLIFLKIYFEILLKYVETNDNLKFFLPQRELDIGLGCSWHVVVGEAFSFSVDFEKVLHCILTSSKYSKSRWDFCLARCDSSDADFADFFPDFFSSKGVPLPLAENYFA